MQLKFITYHVCFRMEPHDLKTGIKNHVNSVNHVFCISK